MKSAKIVVVLSGWPRRSETFALNELLALEAHGLLAAVFATKDGDGRSPHPDVARLRTPVHTLAAGNPQDQAAELVQALSGRVVTAIHAYFAHLPATVAALAASHLNIPYGFSVHARDVRKIPAADLAQRARAAACIVACNRDVARAFDNGIPVHLVPHGVNTQRFRPQPPPAPEPLRLLAVGRLVEKKGFAVLIEAVALLAVWLPKPFQLRIIGDGPLRPVLATAIERNGLVECIQLVDGQTHAQLPQAYANAHIIVVPSLVDSSGDYDGLPNVVLEAMASGRPVVASDVGAISSAVTSGVTGFLVPPGDAATLARTLATLAWRPQQQQEMGQKARARVERDFEWQQCSDRFCRLLRDSYLLPPHSPMEEKATSSPLKAD